MNSFVRDISEAHTKVGEPSGQGDTTVSMYEGQGTHESPFVVVFHAKDQDDPMSWSLAFRWYINIVVG